MKSEKSAKSGCGRAVLPILLMLVGAAGLAASILIFSARQAVYMAAQGEYAQLQAGYLAPLPSAPPSQAQQPAVRPGALSAGQEAVQPAFRVDLSALQELNADCMGWIEIPDTGISYPVVRAADNDYYITHTFQKKQNKAGAIFMDYRCDTALADFHTILFGHNMRDGSMFALLDSFQDSAFRQAHSTILLHTGGGVYAYRIVLAKQTAYDDELYALVVGNGSEQAMQAQLRVMLADATGEAYPEDARFLTLSTCADNHDQAARDIVVAVQQSEMALPQ